MVASFLRHCACQFGSERRPVRRSGDCRMISATLRNFESVVRFVHDLCIKRESDPWPPISFVRRRRYFPAARCSCSPWWTTSSSVCLAVCAERPYSEMASHAASAARSLRARVFLPPRQVVCTSRSQNALSPRAPIPRGLESTEKRNSSPFLATRALS